MAYTEEFNLAEVLTEYQTDSAQLIEERYATAALDVNHLRDTLHRLTDKLTVSPESINNEKYFDRSMYLL